MTNETVVSESSSFEVQIASTGQIIVVPEDVSVVDTLDAEGIAVPVSCE